MRLARASAFALRARGVLFVLGALSGVAAAQPPPTPAEPLKVIGPVHFVGTLAHFKKLSGAQLAVMSPDDELAKSKETFEALVAKEKP